MTHLASGLLVAFLSALPGLAQDTGTDTNVALGKTYTCSSPGGIAWRGLLDGDVESDQPPGCFATGADAAYPKKIVIDLGAVYVIDQVIVYSSVNGNTKKVDLWASRDGASYRQLREPYVFPKGVAQRMSARFPALQARYVKVALWDTWGGGLGGDNVLFLREVEAMGQAAPVTEGTRTRPEIPRTAPRTTKLFRHLALQEGRKLDLLVIGDDAGVATDKSRGLAQVLTGRLKDRFSLAEVETTDACQRGLTARAALVSTLPSVNDSQDLVVVALGTADSLAFDAADFRDTMQRLFARLLDDTAAFIIVIAPPRIPHSTALGRADECTSADTADPAWQLASLTAGTEIAIIDGDAAIQESGLPLGSAYADNLTLGRGGLEALADAVVRLLVEA